MQYLVERASGADSRIYSIHGAYESGIERYIATTPESRSICNLPEILGCEFSDLLRSAVTRALRIAPFRQIIEKTAEHRVCVLNFLRGGLNFDLRGALRDAYGFNCQSSAFMSSQRFRQDGRWGVREDMYRKLMIPPEAVLMTGDVVATGVTVGNGLRVLLEHLQSIGSSIRKLVFVTIGCHKVEKQLAESDRAFREAFPGFEGSIAVYLEGKFKLVDSRSGLRISVPGTDLIRRGALLAPEFELSQYDDPAYPLERCVVYDAGSRAFDIPTYRADLCSYWEKVADQARQGWTLREALAERWPEADYETLESLVECKSQQWQGVARERIESLHAAYTRRWNEVFSRRADSSEALLAVCRDRMGKLVL
ncbi:MAG: hypothetical protein JXR96_04175 [Deltaproteobacteria bacterium]|nr:hypothetical protein [Deltaproteobacteria bacterium]